MIKLQEKLKWRYQLFLIHMLRLTYQFKKHDHYDNVILFGSGRSGTTFLGESLGKLENAKLVDEPLKRTSSHKIHKMKFAGWGQYIPEEGTEWQQFYDFFDRLLSGKEFNPNHIRTNEKLFSTKLWIFKLIRGNLLMPWLIKHFNIKKPIYILRNPYAVVTSRLNHSGWGLGRPLEINGAEEFPYCKFHQEYFDQYKHFFESITRREELLTLNWIVENEYLINHPLHNKAWVTVTYEEIVTHPVETLYRLGKEVGFKVNDAMIEVTQKPSFSSNKRKIDINTQLNGWRNKLSDEQIELITGVLKKSSLTQLYPLE